MSKASSWKMCSGKNVAGGAGWSPAALGSARGMDAGPGGSPVSLHEPGSDAVHQGGARSTDPEGVGWGQLRRRAGAPRPWMQSVDRAPVSQAFLGENVLVKIKRLLSCFHCYSTRGEVRLLTHITWIHTWVAVARAGMGWTLAMGHRMKASSQSRAGKPHGLMGGLCPKSAEQTSERT